MGEDPRRGDRGLSLLEARSVVILTGAGISKESGLDTFRDRDGLWSKIALEDVATPEAFRRDPGFVQGFYNARRRHLLSPDVRPNAAHRAIAEFEARWTGDFLLVTQNIDDLHERAGSRRLVHMHGELLKARCTHCHAVREHRRDIEPADACSSCGGAGTLRPHVVWFGEVPFAMETIFAALRECDLFLSIGTSGSVHPAAGFVLAARSAGARTIEVNLEPGETTSLFDEHRHGPATGTVPPLLSGINPRSPRGE